MTEQLQCYVNEDLQDLLDLTPPKYVLFIIGDSNANVRSQEIPGVTGKFGLRVQNEAGQRLIEFCQGNHQGSPVGLHNTVQLQVLQQYWLGHRLTVILNGLPWK